eukprot:g5441.t1
MHNKLKKKRKYGDGATSRHHKSASSKSNKKAGEVQSTSYPGKLPDITCKAHNELKSYCNKHNIGRNDIAVQEDLIDLRVVDMLKQLQTDIPCEIFEIFDDSNPVKKAAISPCERIYGVKATKNIAEGSPICEYLGKIMTTEEYQTECGSIEWIDKQPSRLYAFDVLKGKLIIDGSPAVGDYGPGCRINDGPGPNNNASRPANVRYVECIVQHQIRILIIAKVNISKGEEILASYGSDFWAGYSTVRRENKSIKEKVNRVYKHCENEIKNLKYLLKQHADEIRALKRALSSKKQENLELHLMNNKLLLKKNGFKPIDTHGTTGVQLNHDRVRSSVLPMQNTANHHEKRAMQLNHIIAYAASKAGIEGPMLKHLVRTNPKLKDLTCTIAKTNIIHRENLINSAISKISKLIINAATLEEDNVQMVQL